MRVKAVLLSGFIMMALQTGCGIRSAEQEPAETIGPEQTAESAILPAEPGEAPERTAEPAALPVEPKTAPAQTAEPAAPRDEPETASSVPEADEKAEGGKIYEGRYFDESFYQYVDMPAEESPLIYCEIMVSNVTDTSFDFSINEIVMATGESRVLVPAAAALIQEGETKAVYQGDDLTLTFSFPDDRDTFPQHLEISGMEQTENKVYINNTIPGHESG